MKVRKRPKRRNNNDSGLSLEDRVELMEQAGFDAEDAELLLEQMEDGGDGGGGGGGDSSEVDGILQLIGKVIKNPNLNLKETIKRVSGILKSLKDMVPGGDGSDAAGDDEAAKAAASLAEGDGDDDAADGNTRVESKADKRIAEYFDKMEVRELCESHDFKPSAKQLRLLIAADEDDRSDLIESWAGDDEDDDEDGAGRRQASRSKRPKSRSFLEGRGGGRSGYKDSKDFAGGLLRR